MTDRFRRLLGCLLIVLASAIGGLVATPAGASTSASAAAAGTARPATVAPGDTIIASVSTVYGLTVGDSPNYSNGFVTPLTGCPCGAYTSAEWIAQDPTDGSGYMYPLAQFSPWTVSNAGVKLTSASTDSAPAAISSFPDTQLTMTNGSAVKAQPGALNSSGTGFTVTWQQSS